MKLKFSKSTFSSTHLNPPWLTVLRGIFSADNTLFRSKKSKMQAA